MTHALVAGTAYKLSNQNNKRVLFLCLLGSVIPDADVIGFKLGIQYADMLGHRGATHSIVFALFYALFSTYLIKEKLLKRNIILFFLFFFSVMSHGLLDMLTNGGLGIGIFIPFTEKRYFFPIRPIEVSPLGYGFFSKRGLDVVINEFMLICTPCLLMLGIKKGLSLKKSKI